jgi:phosphohistidine phosphatase
MQVRRSTIMAESKAEHSMDLLLWRHADAEDGIPDAGRALTKKGLRQAKLVAEWLKPRLPGEYLVLASPAKRAQQTAAALELPYTTERGIGVSASVADIVAATGWPTHKGAVVVVGHQPTLGYLASRLLAGEQAGWTIKKGALWWFSIREGEVILRAVVSPDLL